MQTYHSFNDLHTTKKKFKYSKIMIFTNTLYNTDEKIICLEWNVLHLRVVCKNEEKGEGIVINSYYIVGSYVN